jgi:hypothetical protein
LITFAAARLLAPLKEKRQADTAQQAEGRCGGSRAHPQLVFQTTDIQPLVTFAFNPPMFSPGGQELLGAELLGGAAGNHVVAVAGGLSFLGDFPNDQAQLRRARQTELYGLALPTSFSFGFERF